MAWIRMIEEAEAEGELREYLDAARDPGAEHVDEILRVHSLHPAGLAAHIALYRAVMAGTKRLRKVDRELIALVVSRLNGCHY